MITLESKLGIDYTTDKPAQLHRWVCSCGRVGCWLLSESRAQANARIHATFPGACVPIPPSPSPLP